MSPRSEKKATYVLVHGAAHGGWCWKKVAPALRKAGHDVFTPTLTGLGERVHLLNKDVDLNTHALDIVNMIEYWDLDQVVLVSHSYGGLIATLVADRIPQRIRQLVYLDAQVPFNGQSWSSLHSSEIAAQRIEAALEYTKSKNLLVPVMPFSAPFDTARSLGVTDLDDIAWVNRLVTDQPLITYTQPVKLKNLPTNGLKRAYVDCIGLTLTTFSSVKARIRKESGWDYITLNTGHHLMVTAPDQTISILLKYS